MPVEEIVIDLSTPMTIEEDAAGPSSVEKPNFDPVHPKDLLVSIQVMYTNGVKR